MAAAGCEFVTGLSDARQAVSSVVEAGATLDAARIDPTTIDPPQADAGFDDTRWAVASLANHTCAVGADQHAYCWGDNSEGQLGDGTTSPRSQPVQVGTFADVVDVAVGYAHSCLVRANGDVYCWGRNDRGQLGDGTYQNRYEATKVSTSFAKRVSSGGWHTCVLTQIGGVRCWGDNYYGALGDGTFTQSTSYVDVKGLSNVRSLGVGSLHGCAATEQGKVHCWGRAVFGQVGYAVDGGNGSPDPTDYGSPTATEIAALTEVVEVVSGEDHSCAFRGDNGLIKCWGRNDYAQFGDGTKNNGANITPRSTVGGLGYAYGLTAGKFTTCGIFAGKLVRCWGENNFGQLGNNNLVPGPYEPSPAVNGLADVTRVVTNEHTCAWQHHAGEAGKLLCWGRNDKGQLGVGHVSDYELAPQEVVFPQVVP